MKPSFFDNELLAEVAYEWRLLFAGLWGLADRAGRLEDRPRRIKAEVFPHDSLDVGAGLARLDDNGLIKRYTTSTGKRVIQILCWVKHARPYSDEPPSAFPGPDEDGSQATPAADTLTLAFDDTDDERENTPKKAPFQNCEGGLRTLSSNSVLEPLTSNSVPLTSSLLPGTSNSDGAAARAEEEEEPATRSTLVERFECFWRAYPRKQGRGAAFRSWERLKPNDALLARMLAAIEVQRHSHDWQKDGGQFIPHPATWLNQERWLDEGLEPPVGAALSTVSRGNLAARDEAIRRIRGEK